MISSVQILQ